MTSVSLAILGKVDDSLRRRLEDSRALKDYLIGGAGCNFLLATSDKPAVYEGVNPVRLDIHERGEQEELLAFIANEDVDYSGHAYRVYADPFNTPGLVSDARIGDGFIIRAGRPYDSPEDTFRLLRALKAGARVDVVYRRDGEAAAAMDGRVFIARCGPYHPGREDILRPLKAKAEGSTRIQILSFSVKDGRLTVDNTHKPKTGRLPPGLRI